MGRVGKGEAKKGIQFAKLRSKSVCLVTRPGKSQNQVTRSGNCQREKLSRCSVAAGMQGWLKQGRLRARVTPEFFLLSQTCVDKEPKCSNTFFSTLWELVSFLKLS